MGKTIKEEDFQKGATQALERASHKVRLKAAAENRPLVFLKNDRVIKTVPKQPH